jgi:lipopolysaccharide assembly outer membrane protein LptD (OstA)
MNWTTVPHAEAQVPIPSTIWTWTAPAKARSLRKPAGPAQRHLQQQQNRGVPIASIDSGLYFDRNTNGSARTIARPSNRACSTSTSRKGPGRHSGVRHQRNTFSYASLFRDNRFSGSDRIGDENKLSLGVTSRWIEDNGFERQRVSVGQAYYFKDREVQLPGIDRPARTRSRRIAIRAGIRVPLQPRLARHCRLQLGPGQPQPSFRQRDVPLPA